jgi:mono/diheme cytochrome c family protein
VGGAQIDLDLTDREGTMKRNWLIGLALGIGLAAIVAVPLGIRADGGPTGEVTFAKQVAPILYRNCAVCHHPGTVAPMSLLTYKETRPWARAIEQVVATRTMPPWHADPKYGAFENDRHLDQKDIDTIVAWVNQGAKEGNPADQPAIPKFADQEGWSIGKPDVVLSMDKAVSVPDTGTVPYRFFAVPTNFTEDRYVQAAEIHRGNAALVHHVIINVLEPGAGPLPAAGEINIEGGEGRGGPRVGGGRGRNANPDGMLVGWAPGMSPLVLKPGQAKLIKKGSVLIFQMHYTTNGEGGTDQTSVGLKFSRGPVEKRVITTGAFARQLDIPPGDPNYETTAMMEFKEDSHILNFMPHMHLRGKDFQYRLVLPDGSVKILLNVPRYDFSWQTTYIFKDPVAAPKGSKIECTAHFDNSTNNKYNPDPTREVRWGQQTWEEMMIGWLDYTIDSQDLKQETVSAR